MSTSKVFDPFVEDGDNQALAQNPTLSMSNSDDSSMTESPRNEKLPLASSKQTQKGGKEGVSYDGATFNFNGKNKPREHRDDIDIEALRRMELERSPMSSWERSKLGFAKFLPCFSMLNGQGGQRSSQIHIPPTDEAQRNFFTGLRHVFHMQFHDLIVWQITTSYLNYFSFVCLGYLVWCNIFALIIYGFVEASWAQGVECITTYEFGPNNSERDFHQNMEYAFELSWTTFSTVGYGAISPGTNAGCYWIRYICTIEAFVGVIYFGFSGAVFFSKITRILERAPVTFSSSICIQYDNKSDDVEQGTSKTSNFPVLEFRVVNDKANMDGWEILETELNCMVSVDISKEEHAASSQENNTVDDATLNTASSSSELFSIDLSADSTNEAMRHVPIAKQVFYKLDMETESHPYFRRVWYLRHVLNEQSPLLAKDTRDELAKNGGQWPTHLNTHAAVRDALVKFNTMIVTLKGTLNITSAGVFTEKRYKYEDLCVGYKFAGMLYLVDRPKKLFGGSQAPGKKLQVDLALVNDVIPQIGGGAEPLGNQNIAPINFM